MKHSLVLEGHGIPYGGLEFLQIHPIPFYTATSLQGQHFPQGVRTGHAATPTYRSTTLIIPYAPHCNQGLTLSTLLLPLISVVTKKKSTLCWDWLKCREISAVWAQVPLPTGKVLWAGLLPVALSVIRSLSWRPKRFFKPDICISAIPKETRMNMEKMPRPCRWFVLYESLLIDLVKY